MKNSEMIIIIIIIIIIILIIINKLINNNDNKPSVNAGVKNSQKSKNKYDDNNSYEADIIK